MDETIKATDMIKILASDQEKIIIMLNEEMVVAEKMVTNPLSIHEKNHWFLVSSF